MNYAGIIATIVATMSMVGCGPRGIEPPCDPESVTDRYGFAKSHDIKPYVDLRQAMSCSKETGRPIFLFIHGWASVSNRQPWEIFEDRSIRKLIHTHFVLCYLVLDDRTQLTPADTIGFPPLSRRVETIGQQNSVFLADHFQVSSGPFMVVIDQSITPLHEPLMWQGRETIAALEAMLKAVADGGSADTSRKRADQREFNLGLLQT